MTSLEWLVFGLILTVLWGSYRIAALSDQVARLRAQIETMQEALHQRLPPVPNDDSWFN